MSHPIEVLFQNEDFVFVNKPSGIPVHRSRECPDVESLVEILRRQLGPMFPVHRLDRGVSGVLGIGLTSDGARRLQGLLSQESTDKTYVALVRGRCEGKFTVDKQLTNDNGVVQSAKTDFEVISAGEFCSVVFARIYTGRRHQIRRHLSFLAHQILGDRHYGKGRLNNFYKEKYGLNRIFLHAREINITLENGETLLICCPLAQDLKEVLNKISDEGLLTPIPPKDL